MALRPQPNEGLVMREGYSGPLPTIWPCAHKPKLLAMSVMWRIADSNRTSGYFRDAPIPDLATAHGQLAMVCFRFADP
jgi:hypothetical protein